MITLIKWLVSLFEKTPVVVRPIELEPIDLTPVEPEEKKPEPKIELPLPRQRLYLAAVAALGTDASPNDIAPDELACAESVCNIIKKTFPEDKMFVITLSTISLFKYFSTSPLWEKVTKPVPGDIIISVTGTSTLENPTVRHGHVGIVGKHRIMSNTSFDMINAHGVKVKKGTWDDYYTLDSWNKYYVKKGGLKTCYFRRK